MRTLPLYNEQTKRLAVEHAQPMDVDRYCERCSLAGKKDSKGHWVGPQTVCMTAAGEPGGLLFVSDYPGRAEDQQGEPMVGESGQFLHRMLRKYWDGPVAVDNALRCKPSDTKKIPSNAIEKCRPYLAQTIREVQPQRIIAAGGQAVASVFGEAVPVLSVRRGIGWLYNEGEPIPVFLNMNPVNATRNRFLRNWFVQDLKWACQVPLDQIPIPPWLSESQVIQDLDDAEHAFDVLEAAGGFTYDVETVGRVGDTFIEMVCCATTPYETDDAYIWTRKALHDPQIRALFVDLFKRADLKKSGTNLKFDTQIVEVCFDIDVRGTDVDTRLMRKLIWSDVSGYLEHMAYLVAMGGHKREMAAELNNAVTKINKGRTRRAKDDKRGQMMLPGTEFAEDPDEDELDEEDVSTDDNDIFAQEIRKRTRARNPDLQRYLKEALERKNLEPKAFAFGMTDPDVLYRYNALDSISTERLRRWHLPHMEMRKAEPLRRIWNKVVSHTIDAIAQVETWGMPVSETAIKRYEDYLKASVTRHKKFFKAYDANPDSPAQMAKLLFEELKLHSDVVTETGAYSTGNAVLEKLAGQHEAAAVLKEYRAIEKLRGTYATGMLDHIRDDGRVHPSINMDGAACLPHDELVLTSRGYIEARNVQVGDLVITHRGRTRPVSHVIHNAPAAIYKVTTRSGLTLRTTAAHEYYTLGGWVRADELHVGQILHVHGAPEEWRPVAGWPYLVSSWGRVKHERRKTPLTMMTMYKGTNKGHHKVTLMRGNRERRSGNRKDMGVHRLVLGAFVGPVPFIDAEARHLNGIAWDNTQENLAWGTRAENRADGQRHGSLRGGTKQKLTANQVRWIREIPRNPNKQARHANTDAALARRFGVSKHHIRDIRTYRRRRDLRSEAEREQRVMFRFESIVRIELEAPEPNIGLVVEEDHSHVTGNIVTHNSGRTSCLVASTLIRTRRGNVSIENVDVGDLVWTHKGRWRPVVRHIKQGVHQTFTYRLATGDVLHCTPDHRVLTDSEWVEIGDCYRYNHAIAIDPYGNNLEPHGSTWLSETKITGADFYQRCEVFDLEVQDDHSFLANGVYVHNCSNPNLQNIPRGDNEYAKRARRCFVAPPGYYIVQLDYSQLELRVAALLSGDQAMLEIFLSGLDYHLRTAQMISNLAWNIDSEQVGKYHRSQAKIVNFATLYGKSAHGLALQMGSTVEEAQKVQDSLFGRMQDLKAWIDECVATTRETGFAWTWWDGERARRRPLWRIGYYDEAHRQQASTAFRSSWNSPIQGSASEFCVASLCQAVDWLKDQQLKSQLVLAVHDSLMFLCPEDEIETVARGAHDIMVSHNSSDVPLVVDVEVGRTWGDLEKYTLKT